MIKNLDTSHSLFKSGQLLTSSGLNDVRDYLDSNIRVNRSSLNGMGIICGLEATFNESGASKSITITAGMGITSEGYLVCLEEDKTYDYYDDDFSTEYNFRKSDLNSYDQFRLTDSIAGFSLANLADPENYAVVLMVDFKDEDIDFCVNTNGDFGGQIRKHEIVPLLVRKTDLTPFNSHDFVQRSEFFTPKRLRREFAVFPFDRQQVDGNGDLVFDNTDPQNPVPVMVTINGFEDCVIPKDFILVYENIIKNVIEDLADDVTSTLADYVPFLGIQMFDGTAVTNTTVENLVLKINGVLKDPAIYDDKYHNIQILYDFLKDLTDALQEFLNYARATFKDCVPNSANLEDCFSRHIALGSLRPYTKASAFQYADEYRNTYVQKFVIEDKEQEIFQAQAMLEKIVRMVTQFNFPEEVIGGTETAVRITPTLAESAPLEKRALPFYYNVKGGNGEEVLWHQWNTNSYLNRSWEGNVMSYHLHEGNIQTEPAGQANAYDQVKYPLHYDHDHLANYRIEGHLGKDLNNVIQNLKDIRRNHNLSFDIKHIVVSNDKPLPLVGDDHPDFDIFNNFMDECPGAQHTGIIPRGGTIILVHDGTKVIGDLSVPPSNFIV